ncbi:uncharacterized protein LOC112517370 isoform X2 [Cynara cardunculus var. scolymus]|uniref:uncharacterized protein LOC112517370 isoform X2 n=1 Tax=Cynara cardunculus var. scolymus TaxID=59895 RepID=UPI000D625309|nr:uncharacterized protein LOC112517370 isoform X2 [Cynara cardunculus var. scolymus]
MPGSIQVSVLDFKELPSSSNFVKVSLGKVEHEAGEKGTFSFPLTNLRDNLIITILDLEGNQVSRSGVRTISIIEKGIWDDLFPIEGGGVIHMKLQFILSDEERNRIRSMREYAMKKKQDEILNSRLRNAESAKSLASSMSRHEVSDVLRITSSQDFQRSSSNGDAAKAGFLTPLDDTFKKASEANDGIKEESFQRQSFTNATDRMEEASFSLVTEGMHQKILLEDAESLASQTDLAKKNETVIPSSMIEKLEEQNLEEKIPSYINKKAKERAPTPLLQEPEVNSDKNNEIHAAKSKPSDNVAEKLDKRNLEETSVIYVKKTSKESKPPHSSQETKVNTIKNDEIQLQQTDAPKRLLDGSSPDVRLSSSVIAEKIKSFSPKLAGEEPDKQGTPEKTPRNIKKMISVFESSISQDRVPLKPVGTKAYRVGTVRLLKDHAVNTSEMSSSTRLRNSFSTGDLRRNLSGITTKGEQAGFNENMVEPTETNMQSKGMIGSEGDTLISDDPKETQESSEKGVNNEKKVAFRETSTKKMEESSEKGVSNEEKVTFTETNTKEIRRSPKEGVNNEEKSALTETNTIEILKSRQEDATVSGRMHEDDKQAETLSNKVKDGTIDGKKTSKDNLDYIYHDGSGPWIFPDEERHFCMTAEKAHQENTIASIPDSIGQDEAMARISGNSSPKSSDEEDSTGSLGQAIKIALVIGFGVLVLLFRQREPGNGKKKGNNLAVKNQVFMNKRGSIGERSRKTGVLRLS